MDPIALVAALASATGFALSTSLQHHAAGTVPDDAHGLIAFIRHLLSRPTWLIGQFLALCSFLLHAVALHFGAIAVVQPIVVSGIVIAVPMRALMSHRLPMRAEVVAVVVTTIGLAVFLVASNPSHAPATEPSLQAFAVFAVFIACAVVVNFASGRAQDPRRRAAMLGVTAGVLFGVVAGGVKLVLDAYSIDGLEGAVLNWPLWLVLLCGAGGIVSNQRAYRLASLSASLPMLNILNVVVSLLIGLFVFDEIPTHTPIAITCQALALLAVAVGLQQLAKVEEHDEGFHAPTPL